MADNFGLRIGVEGEKEFRNALKDIQQSFKVLGSEMLLVTSQFDKNDKSVQALTSRNTVLNKEIEAQKGKIEVLKAALDNAASSFGENDKRTQDWQIQLNKAQAELNGMERELSQNNKALDEAEQGFGDAGQGAEGFGKAVDGTGKELSDAEKETGAFGKALDGTGKELGDAEKQTGALGKALDEAGKELDDTGKETKKLGSEMEDTGKKTSIFGEVLKANLAADLIKAGLSAIVDMVKAVGAAVKDYVSEGMEMASAAAESQTLLTQVMRNVMNASDDEVQSLISLAAAQEKVGVVSKTAQVTALAELASFVERKGALEDMLPVMNDYIAYQYGTTASSEQARNVATALGKAIQGNIDGLAKQGFTLSQNEKEWFKTATEAERVAFVIDMVSESMDGVNTALAQTDAGKMANLTTVMDNTKIAVGAMANEFKARIMGQMLPSISSLSDAFLGVLRGEGSVEALADSFNGVFTEIVHIIETFLPKMLELGGQVLTGIVTGIANNMDSLVEGALSIVDMLSKTLLDLLPMILDAGMNLLFGLVDGIIQALPDLAEAAIQIIVALIQGLSDALPRLIPAIVEAVVLICQTLVDNLPLLLKAALQMILGLAEGLLAAIPQLIAALPTIIGAIVDFIIGAIPQIIEAGIQLLISLVTALPTIITAIVAAIPQIISNVIGAVIGAIPQIIEAGISLLVSLIQALPQIITTVVAAIPKIVAGLVDAIIGNIDKIILAGVQLLVALIENLPTIIVEVVKAIPQIIAGIVSAIVSFVPALADAGLNLIKGVWQGISDAGAWLRDKISGFFGGVVDSIKKFFGIRSPSTLFAGIGKNMGEGIGVGFEEAMKTVAEDMRDAIPTEFDLEPNVRARGSAGYDGRQGPGGNTIHQNISITSPKALSEKEAAREFRNLSRKLALEY